MFLNSKLHNTLLIVLLFLFFSIQPEAQVLTVYALTQSSEIDTAQVGFHPSASLFEDVALGEKNLFGLPLSSGIDLRVLQRRAENQECVMIGIDSLAYVENFDSNINLRSPTSNSPEYLDFFIKTNSDSVTTLFLNVPEGIPTVLENASVVLDSCNGTIWDLDWDGIPPTAQVFSVDVSGSSIYAMIVRFKSDVVSTDYLSDKNQATLLYPNPSSGILNFDPNLDGAYFSIFNQAGSLILSDVVRSSEQFYLPNFIANGFYFIQFTSKNGERTLKPLVIQR